MGDSCPLTAGCSAKTGVLYFTSYYDSEEHDMKWAPAGILIFSLLITGCAEEKTGTTAGDTSEAGTFGATVIYNPSIPVNDGKKTSVAFWTQIDQESIYRKLIDDYMELHPNVRIELTAADYTNHFQKLRIALQSEIGPDMFHLHNSFARALIPFMQPYPHDVLPYAALEKDFRQVDSHLIDGEIYFIDTGLMTSSIYYNLDIWKAAGLTERDIPRTWDELRRVAKRLTRYDPTGKIEQAGFNPNGIGFALFTAMNLQQGQSLFRGADPLVPIVDTEASRRSLQFIVDLYYADRVADIRFPQFHESFGMGDAAMIYAWGWTNNWLQDHSPDLRYDIFQIPAWSLERPPVFDRNNGESSMGVNRGAPKEKQDAAFDLIKFFLASDKYLLELSRQFGVAPSKYSLDNHPDLHNDRLLATFTGILDQTVWPGLLPDFYEEILTSTLIDPIVIDRKNIDSTLAATEKRLISAFASAGEIGRAGR